MEFVEVPARHFDDHVVQRRLEEGRSGFGDLVFQFVQRITDGQFGGDLGDRVAGGFAGQRGGARHAGVDLHGDQFFGLRVLGKLYVAAAGKIAEGTHHGHGIVAHLLVGGVGQRHGRRYGDRVTGVDAHRIEIFDRADNDHVVEVVAQQFQLEFLPAQHGFFHQHLVGGRGVQTRV